MASYRTLLQYEKRRHLHDFVLRQIHAGRDPREVLDNLNKTSIGMLVTLHQVTVRNQYDGQSNHKADRVEAWQWCLTTDFSPVIKRTF